MKRCQVCASLQGALGFARNDLGTLRGRMVRRGVDAAMVEAVKAAKEQVARATLDLETHEADCEYAKSKGPRDWRIPAPFVPPKAKVKQKDPRSLPIDPDAVAAVLAKPVPTDSGRNRLPVTGRCHTCDRVVSGERRYCGPCLARRA